MILPSINTLNCGKLLRTMDTIPSSNALANRKNTMDWTIRSQATRKLAEGSTTMKSSLTRSGMANFARTGWTVALVKGNSQDIVWATSRDVEDRIKSLSITPKEIKKHGDTVHIRTVPDITIRSYSVGQALTYERPEGDVVDLLIDKGQYYAMSINLVEMKQADVAYIEKWTDDAGEQLKIAIDADILGNVYSDASADNVGATAGVETGAYDMGASGAPVALDKTNILDFIVDMGSVLDEQNIPETGRWLVLPPVICGMIKKSDLKDASLTGDAQSMARNGRLGTIDRFMIYKSNQVETSADSSSVTAYNIMAGTRAAITFASQLTNNETIKNPNDFGDLMRGLQVYGYEVIKPEALVHGYVYRA